MATCPSADELLALLDDSLVEGRRVAIRRHLDGCHDCSATIAALAQSHGGHAELGVVAWPEPGDLFVDRYRIVQRLGAGASGVVFEADDTQLQRRVALKLLRAAAGPRDLAVARLSRESRAMAALRHPNVVTVYDMGVGAAHLWVAMELIEGQSLRQWCTSSPRSAEAILGVFRQATAGLQAAHDAGIVHRDFKPDNVLVDRDGGAFVGDFGLASFASTSSETVERAGDGGRPEELTLTRTDTVVGTPAYLSPEGWRGDRVTARADVFALCVSLYEALHGRRPYQADSIRGIRAQVERGEHRPVGPQVPRRLRPLLRAGLSPHPQRRPTLAALIDAMRPQARRWASLARWGGAAGLVGVAAWAVASSRSEPTVAPSPIALHVQCREAGTAAALPDALLLDVDAFVETAPSGISTRLRAGIDDALAAHNDGRRRVCGRHAAGEIDTPDLELRLRCYEMTWMRLTGRIQQSLTSEEPLSDIRRFRGLPDCEDPKLAEVLPLHDDAALATYVELSRDLATLEVKQMSGGFARIEAEVNALEERARALDMHDVRARALYMRGSSLHIAGQLIPARDTLIAAADAAVSSGNDVIAVRAWNSLTMMLVQDFEDTARAEEYLRYAKASIARIDDLPIVAELETENLYHEGFLRLRQGRMDEALAAIEAGTKAAKVELPEMLGNYEELRALIYAEMGQHEDAIEAGKRALQTRLDTVGGDHPYTGYSRALLGAIYSEAGKAERAAEELIAARKIMEKAFGTPNGEVSFRYKEEAMVLANLGRHDEAREAMRLSGETMSEAGKTDKWLDDYLQSQAHVATLANDFETALEFSRQSLRVAKRLDPDGNQEQWMASMTVANTLSELGRASEALPFANDWAAPDRESTLSPSDFALVNSVAVEVFIEAGRYAEALVLIKQGLETPTPPPPPEEADLTFAMARAHLGLGDRAEAARIATKAAALVREIGSADALEALNQWARDEKIALGSEPAVPASGL